MRDRDRDGNGGAARRALLLSALALSLAGCDVAVAALLASRSSKSSSSDAPPPPDLTSKIWLADLSTLSAADLTTEESTIIAAGGVPAGPRWTSIPLGTSTSFVIDLVALGLAGPFDTVLIQCPKAQPYSIDGFEVLGSNDIVLETATTAGIRHSFFINSPTLNAASPPDGLVTTSDVTVATNDSAFLFSRFSAAFTRVRVNLWATAVGPGPGDLTYSTVFVRSGNQIAGGAAVNASNQVHIAFRESATIGVVRFGVDGVRATLNGNSFLSVEPDAATIGSPSVAIDSQNSVIVAVTRTDVADTGYVRVRKYTPDLPLAPIWTSNLNTSGADLVEWNSLSILSSRDVIVAGAFEYGGVQGIGHFMRRLKEDDGSDRWSATPPSPPIDIAATYWTAVAASGDRTIYSTGDLTKTATIVPYTRKTTDFPVGTIVEDWSDARDDTSGTFAGRGQAIDVDSAGNVFVGGYYSRGGAMGRDMILLRYSPGGSSVSAHFDPGLAGDDEIMDIAVAPDDTIYAVGYETVTSPGQGRNIVLFHISASGTLLMKRTLDGQLPGGNDRAVSVVLGSDGGKGYVHIAGEITVDPDGPGGNPPETDIIVRKYVR
jgi:hypothetical protein